jgi:hypothetical protein
MFRRLLEQLGYWRRSEYMSKEWLHEQLQRERDEYYGATIRWPILEFSDNALRDVGRKRDSHTVR